MIPKGPFMEDPIESLVFDENGLIPVIVQDAESGEVLMLAFANEEAVEKTVETGFAHFFSRSRRTLWKKGETSGNTLGVVSIRFDCDSDGLLYRVRPSGPACHTGEVSCFYRTLRGEEEIRGAEIISRVFAAIEDRRKHRPPGSYVASLFEKGKDAILGKVAEESGELILAAKGEDRQAIVHEAADLIFHALVAMAESGIRPGDVYAELARRFGRSGLEEKASRRGKR